MVGPGTVAGERSAPVLSGTGSMSAMTGMAVMADMDADVDADVDADMD